MTKRNRVFVINASAESIFIRNKNLAVLYEITNATVVFPGATKKGIQIRCVVEYFDKILGASVNIKELSEK